MAANASRSGSYSTCSLSSDPLRLQALPVCMECLLVALML
ncbi:hypothetical protein GGD65_004578 [Bradyrhizobium sp. CIR18]|nr:hypothetical protein [Bradyrhizobium sp. CIR18]